GRRATGSRSARAPGDRGGSSAAADGGRARPGRVPRSRRLPPCPCVPRRLSRSSRGPLARGPGADSSTGIPVARLTAVRGRWYAPPPFRTHTRWRSHGHIRPVEDEDRQAQQEDRGEGGVPEARTEPHAAQEAETAAARPAHLHGPGEEARRGQGFQG